MRDPAAGWRARLARPSSFVAAFFLLVSLPLLGTALLPPPHDRGENRTLAPPPPLPTDLRRLAAFPGRADAWASDHFFLRHALIALDNAVLWRVFGEVRTDRLVEGRHGRLFLASHDGTARDSLITGVCGVGIGETTVSRAAAAARIALDRLARAGLRPTMLIVPTAARLDRADLPPPLARLCAHAVPPADRLAALLEGSDVLYPLGRLRALQDDGIAPIPPHHFHWAGEAPLRIAEDVAEARWHLARTTPIPLRAIGRNSDLGSLNPGMGLADRVREPQLRKIGMTGCVGAACQAETGLPAQAARAIEHDHRPAPGPTLLIVADSFGDEIARNFLEQFGDVWLVHTNVTSVLPPDGRRAVARWIGKSFRGDHALLIFHDYGAVFGLDRATALLADLPGATGGP